MPTGPGWLDTTAGTAGLQQLARLEEDVATMQQQQQQLGAELEAAGVFGDQQAADFRAELFGRLSKAMELCADSQDDWFRQLRTALHS